jgi:hypothetical protein
MPRDYQFSAHTASICCIAMGLGVRCRLGVKGCRTSCRNDTATLRPLFLRLRTCPRGCRPIPAQCQERP